MQTESNVSTRRAAGLRRRGWLQAMRLAVAGAALLSAAAWSQTQDWRVAPIIEPQNQGMALPPALAPAAAPPEPQFVVNAFHDACVQHEGEAAAVIDWALSQGYAPLDSHVLGAQELLGGSSGTVLAAPRSGGMVLLAVTSEPRCVVWAEQTVGPALLSAFQKMVSALGFQGARVRAHVNRNLNAGGAWRNQAQWRYRREGGDQDFGLGSATTLAPSPSTQLLNFAPWPSTPSRDPDGMPRR